jgi:hypothetical protein
MPLSGPRDSTIAVVGDGFSSLIIYATAVYLGFRPEEITIYGPADSPVKTYQQYAYNLGQTVLRSESESHFLPADWPTFAELEAWSRRSLSPLLRSARRRYNPGVPDIMAEANVVAHRLRWDDNRYPHKVGWLQRATTTNGGPPHFVLFDEEAQFIGRAKHVALACGHGPLSYPPVLAKARKDPAMADRIVQAYAPKQYDGKGRYVVIGSGIASVNEWANAIDAGAKCISLVRNPSPDEQDLNTPRCFFEALGIDAFQQLDFDQRIEFLGRILKGTAPNRRGWDAKIKTGREEQRFEQIIGEIDEIKPGPLGLRIHVMSKFGEDPGWMDVTGIVTGTGFNKSALSVPLMRRLIEFYDVPIADGRMKLQSNCGVPGLDRPDSRCLATGLHANSVVTHGDTIAGLKYICRRFVADVYEAEKPGSRNFFSKVWMQLKLANETSHVIRRIRKTEQLA